MTNVRRKKMKILVACEESQVVCKAFRERGHEAYSCDIQKCSGEYPEWHIQDDVRKHLKGWDMIIAHPPCTYLSKAGAPQIVKDPERIEKGFQAKEFFMEIMKADCAKICIENPTPMKRFGLPEPDCIIEPWEFGEPYTKRTLLWLKNLPPLLPTEIVLNTRSWTKIKRTAKQRSKTFPGIAKAMAEQWGNPY